MQRTQNYNLCQWAAEDRILRSDFNADNQKIDAALKAASDAAAAAPRIVTGTYTGDGAATRTISLGFTPKAVLIAQNGYQIADYQSGSYRYFHGGLAVTGNPTRAAAITEGGFIVYQSPSAGIAANTDGDCYHYLAIG